MIIVDLELTGLDPDKHSIIDIGAIDFFNPYNRFNCQCNIMEGVEIDPVALEINGFNIDEILECELPLQEAMFMFHNWSKSIENRTIAGQNIDTDILFLKKTFEFYGFEWDFGHRKIDQHSLACSKALSNGFEIPITIEKVSNFHSDAIMKFVGIPAEIKPHKAINGAIWETEAMSRLIFGTKLLPEFKKYDIPDYLLMK